MQEFFAAQSTVLLSHDPCDTSPLQLVGADHVQSDKSASFANPEAQEHAWMELLREGLTFDLEGIAPGPASEFPEIEHRFDLEQSPNGFRFDAMRISIGQHLSGGERSLPIMRGMVGLARDLTHHFDDVKAVVWSPSKSAIGRQYFESVSTAWIEGGSFPALGLTAFRETIDGALQTVGLDYWIGQELRIEPPLAGGKFIATRLGVRLVNQLILVGGLSESERIVAPDGGRLIMRSSKNSKFVRVCRE